MCALAKNQPLSDAGELFLTNVFTFIHRLRGLSRCYFQHFVVRCPYIHCWMPLRKWEAFRHDTKLGLCGHLAANQEKAPSRDVRSFRYPRAHPAQWAAPAARSGRTVQPGTPPGQRPRQRAQPSETRAESTQAGSDWSVQERWVTAPFRDVCLFVCLDLHWLLRNTIPPEVHIKICICILYVQWQNKHIVCIYNVNNDDTSNCYTHIDMIWN